MIFRNHNLIFLHVAKAAGTAIENNLCRTLGGQTTKRFNPNLVFGMDPKSGLYAQHYTLNEMIYCGYVSRKEAHQCFKFCVIRNPFDRLVSLYFYLVASTGFGLNYPTFTHLASNPNHINYFHALPQKLYTVDCDFVARYETIDQDYKTACELAKIPYHPLTVENKSHKREHKDYRVYYTPETRNIIEEFYKDELETYGYEF